MIKRPLLVVSHYIYLDRRDRYNLHKRKKIKVVGVSVPVFTQNGYTNEPANEIFCEYILTNLRKDSKIIKTEKGYQINLPQKVKNGRLFSRKILDYKDGGENRIIFKEYNKVLHYIEIKPIEILKESLYFIF